MSDEQLGLKFDAAAARAARDEAVQRVDDHADPAWRDGAFALVEGLARTQEFLTTDDAWAAGLTAPHEPRALGAVFLTLARRGVIEKTGRQVLSARRACHARPIAVWRSLVYVRSAA